MNTFGRYYSLTSFGESHCPAIGGVIDGMPAGFEVDFDALERFMARRRPGYNPGTARREDDRVEFLSGIYEGKTLGTPIGFIIRNQDARPGDYSSPLYRPNHADYTYDAKYGRRDPRGGGRASARETAVRCVAGALALQALAAKGIDISSTYSAPVAVEGDSRGALVTVVARGVPAGWGSPLADKLDAALAGALMGIPAVKAVGIGDGFAVARAYGSDQTDIFAHTPEFGIHTLANHSGGIQGGISNGAPIRIDVAFKPLATVPGREVPSVGPHGEEGILRMCGRHDGCAAPRALPVVEAVVACVLFDAALGARLDRW